MKDASENCINSGIISAVSTCTTDQKRPSDEPTASPNIINK